MSPQDRAIVKAQAARVYAAAGMEVDAARCRREVEELKNLAQLSCQQATGMIR